MIVNSAERKRLSATGFGGHDNAEMTLKQTGGAARRWTYLSHTVHTVHTVHNPTHAVPRSVQLSAKLLRQAMSGPQSPWWPYVQV